MAKKDEGYLLDDSGERVKSGSGDYVRSGSYDDEKVTENRIKAAEEKLAQDVQKKLKSDSDSARVSKDAEERSKAPTSNGMDDSDRRRKDVANAPKTNQGAAKPKSGIVTKKQLEESGLSLRDYMNKQQGKTRRDGKPPTTTTSKPATTTSKPAGASGILDPQQKAQQKTQPSEPAAKFSELAASGSSKPEPYNPPAVKFFKSLRDRGEKDLAERGMKKGGSVRGAGIAQRGVRKCKMV